MIASTLLVPACLAAVSAARAKPAPPNPVKSLANSLRGLSLAAREQRLASQAREEGQLTVYTSLSSLVLKPLQAEWEKQFPDIRLNVYRAPDEDLVARLLAEEQAGTSGADIVETNGASMLILQHRGDVLVPYASSPYRAGVPKQYRFDTFTSDRLDEYVVAWNTSLVPDPPKSFADLAQPRWKGKLTLEPSDVTWFAALYDYLRTRQHYSARRADALFRAIAANSELINGHTTQSTLLAAGQVDVIVAAHAQGLEQLQAKGAPVSFGPPFVTPVIERPQGVGIAYGLSHPAAALLYYDWLLSPATQRLLLQNGMQPARSGLRDPSFSAQPLTVKMDLRPIVSHYRDWSDRYDSITQVSSG